MKPTKPSFFFLIALIGGLAIFSSTLSKTPVLPLFAHALNASPAEIGWIVMASTIPGVLISYPAGALSDHLGKRRVLLASLIVFASAPFLYLLISNAWQLMAVRFYHGFATAIFGTVASAAIAERYTRRPRGAAVHLFLGHHRRTFDRAVSRRLPDFAGEFQRGVHRLCHQRRAGAGRRLAAG